MTDQAPAAENPLLAPTLLPRFADIEPAHVEPAVREMLAAQREALAEAERVETPDLTWLRKLERINDEIQRVWGPVSHLNSVLSTPPLRDAYNRCLPLVTEFGTELGQNEALYRQFAALKERTTAAQPVERALIDQALRDFRLGGVSLVGAERERFRAIMQQLAAAQASFEQNVMDATDAFEHRETDRDALRGLPERLIESARTLAEQAGAEGWLLRLDPPTYQTVMAHAENVELRAKYYEAWVTRASDRGPQAGRWDNGALIERIMALRHEAAHLVGFKTYTEFSLATKMADSPERVIDFLRDLARRSRPMAEQELAELTRYAGRKLDAWDTAFYAERVRQEKLHLAEEELRPYFPLPQVQAELFQLCDRLFGIAIEQRPNANIWHPTVRYYEIRRADGSLVGSFFTDLFARQNKRGGAWLDTCRSRARLDTLEHAPVAHLVCNFNAPVGDTPSLLTHMEAVTLFHEFGHALHHLLTEVDYPSIAGINGVAWDAVELPSQFLENFVWHPEVLAGMARHYKTGEPLPREKLAALNKSRTFLAGLAMMRQLEFALFDFKLHHDYDPARGSRVLDVLSEVRREVAVVEAPAFNRFPHSFGHVFGGGYAAGYYSYKWAEVLAADAFAAFEEHGVFDRDTAARFRRAILATGGSRNALDAFVEFRGREPSLDPLLKQSGIATQ
jgi:oligopeptidase A